MERFFRVLGYIGLVAGILAICAASVTEDHGAMPDNWHLIGLAGIAAVLFGAGFLCLSGAAERHRQDEANNPRPARTSATGADDLPLLGVAGTRRW